MLRPLLILSIVAGLGCTTTEQPRHRFGCLPFPGPFTLFELADAENLGEHRYSAPPPLDFDYTEQSRGILYTRQAGFIDMAHVRCTADYVRFLVQRIEPAIRDKKTSLGIASVDQTTLHLTFHYPLDWDTMSPEQHEALTNDLALTVAAKAAYDLSNWHEIITWFNYRQIPIIPEKPSSFSYEDVVSHIVGVEVAVRALRNPDRDYDDAMTVAIDQRLQELEAVTTEQTMQAIDAVNHHWWAWGQPRKRHLDIGMDDGEVTPWLVRDVPFALDGPPKPMPIPDLSNIAGRDMSGFVEMTLTTDTLTSLAIKSLFSPRVERFRPREHYPMILTVIRDQMVDDFGPFVATPYRQEETVTASLR